MRTLVNSLITIASVALTDPVITYSYVTTMSLNHKDIDSTAANNVAHSKRSSISFCNIRGLDIIVFSTTEADVATWIILNIEC